jgi:ketosteroid isomerase-like protein
VVSEESPTLDRSELLRRSLDALERGDFDGALATYAPDAVLELGPVGLALVEESPRGHEAIRKFWEEVLTAFEDLEIEITERSLISDSVTLSVLVQRGRPRGSSGFVEMRYAVVGLWGDELAERVTLYTDIDEARTAAERLAEERG